MEPDRDLRMALKQALIFHRFVPSRMAERTVRLQLRDPSKYSKDQIREGIRWIKTRVADADLIVSCKREHVAEHVFDSVVGFMRAHIEDEDHDKLEALKTKLRMSIFKGLADAELGGAFFGV